jgi:hypothetical protein
MFRMLFVTLASETKAPLVSPIYINDIYISSKLSIEIQANDSSNVHFNHTTKTPRRHLSRTGRVSCCQASEEIATGGRDLTLIRKARLR